MNGKIIGIFFLACAILGAIAVYYLQVYAFYEVLEADDVEIRLTEIDATEPTALAARDVQAIDASSSPLRFRACFQVEGDMSGFAETYAPYPKAEPLTGPRWFGCYDASVIGAALVSGEAVAYLGQKNIVEGVDLVAAIFPDGRGFYWHQLNETFAD